ncbi:MAG: GNAT family N-acetyltransferase [Verrucomicrobia bacterium]|nr:GNAT family N-acetyltransferase [Verrucomicrobiota bacterium]
MVYDIDDCRLLPLGFLRFWSRRKIRRLGIGSALLEAFVEEAAKLGVSLVHGSIMHKDLLRNPNLIKFYERCGFRRLPPGPDELAGAICRVELAVPQRADHP